MHFEQLSILLISSQKLARKYPNLSDSFHIKNDAFTLFFHFYAKTFLCDPMTSLHPLHTESDAEQLHTLFSAVKMI